MLSLSKIRLVLWALLAQLAQADVGVISFWVPELYALLEKIKEGNGTVETYTFGARKFYVTQFKGHNIIAANTGVGITNSAATTAVMLQKFPTIDRLIGSGIAGGVDPSLRVGDVVIPERWSLYQKQHFAKEMSDGSYSIPDWAIPELVGGDCGSGLSGHVETATLCVPGNTTWNYTFIFPTASNAANPNASGVDSTIEGSQMYTFFEVDPEMFEVAQAVAPNVTLANAVGNTSLDYEPIVIAGGVGVAGPTFLDNADYRTYAYETFQARAVDMETPAAASVAHQMGKKFIAFRSLSDLAGGDADGNSLGVFFAVAAANAVTTMSAFLEKLPVQNNSPEGTLPVPNDYSPGEDTPDMLGVLSFYEPELAALKNILNEGEPPKELIYGGRKFYRGQIAGAEVVATLTGVSIENAAMTTALMAMLYPGATRIIGGGIAGGIDPALRVGDVVIPEKWAMHQMQVYSRVVNGFYEPVDFERSILVGKDCGGWNGVDAFLTGDRICNYTAGETSNFEFMFPKTTQSPDPLDPLPINQISEGETRKWWFDVDPVMLAAAKAVANKVVLKDHVNGSNLTLGHVPSVFVGGYGLSGPTFVDNVRYREYLYDQFEARCVDMETAAAADVAYQNNRSFLFFRSLSDLAGADPDGNVLGVFFSLAAENAFAVTRAFIEELYPVTEVTPNATSNTNSSGGGNFTNTSMPGTTTGSSHANLVSFRSAWWLSVFSSIAVLLSGSSF